MHKYVCGMVAVALMLASRCVGMARMALAVLFAVCLFSAGASAMTFQTENGRLILSGEVQPGDVERMQAALNANRAIKTIVLRNSPGGSVIVMWNMMSQIRERQLNTAVSGYCLSACAAIFLGGVSRQFTDDAASKSYLGFHGFYTTAGGPADYSEAYIQKQTVSSYIGVKGDDALIDEWTKIRNQAGMMVFFDSNRTTRTSDGASIILCKGTEKSFAECPGILGKNVYGAGIATTTSLVRLTQPDGQAGSSPLPTSATINPSQSPDLVGPLRASSLCVNALTDDKSAWDQLSTAQVFVAEAVRRGMTVDSCRSSLGLKTLGEPRR